MIRRPVDRISGPSLRESPLGLLVLVLALLVPLLLVRWGG